MGCIIVNCDRKVHSKDMCEMHYRRVLRSDKTRQPREARVPYASDAVCKVDNCDSKPRGLGYCTAHYATFRRYGHSLYNKPEYRFWRKVRKTNYCWNWLGKGRCGKSNGYGQISVDNRNVTVHRFSYQLHYGAIPASMHVLHKCDNPICVNPNHLFLGTNLDNVRDKMVKGRWSNGR